MRGLAVTTFVLALAVSACAAGTTPVADAPQRTARPSIEATRAPAPSESGGEVAPDFTIATLGGGTFTLSEHHGSLPVVLNFWAPW